MGIEVMCGRYGVESKHSKQVEEDFNTSFVFDEVENMCPSMLLPIIIKSNQGLQQHKGHWGIQPNWSKKLLINAQSETVAIKPTFKHSFLNYRCIIPMSYWFEWCMVDGQKIKHQFSGIDNHPLYMAGIYFPTNDNKTNVVSLTMAPTKQCKQYHHRMPMVVNDNIEQWLDNGDICHSLTTKFKIKNGIKNVQSSLFDSY